MEENQTIKQKIIQLAQSEHAPVVIEILKQVVLGKAKNLVGDSEYATVVNAVTFDVQQDIIVSVIKLFESVKDGSFINNQ